MMQRRRLSGNQIRRIESRLPYTVTTIGNIDEALKWRVEQARKEADHESRKAHHRYMLIKKIEAGLFDPRVGSGYRSEADKRYEALLDVRPMPLGVPTVYEKPSLLARMYARFYNYFTTLPF